MLALELPLSPAANDGDSRLNAFGSPEVEDIAADKDEDDELFAEASEFGRDEESGDEATEEGVEAPVEAKAAVEPFEEVETPAVDAAFAVRLGVFFGSLEAADGLSTPRLNGVMTLGVTTIEVGDEIDDGKVEAEGDAAVDVDIDGVADEFLEGPEDEVAVLGGELANVND